jgi:hypothetical protein
MTTNFVRYPPGPSNELRAAICEDSSAVTCEDSRTAGSNNPRAITLFGGAS